MEWVQAVVAGGAAAALFWVLKLVTDGKLHSSSETDGLKQDKADLLQLNKDLTEALKASNQTDGEILRILRALPLRYFDRGDYRVDPE
jgi:hypothetical protein